MSSATYFPLFSFIKAPENRKFLIIGLCGMMVQFIAFKLLYPFSECISDSYTYIDVANRNLPISYRPLGYSYFLRGLHFITPSDLLVSSVQYTCLQLSALLFFFTLRFLFNPGKWATVVLFVALLFNPVSLYVGNFIMSDALFCCFSLLWLIQLCFIIKRPASRQIIIQAVLLALAFSLRYTAMYYPLLTVLAFLLSSHSWLNKVGGICLSMLFIYGQVYITKETTLKYTGTRVFTPFSGWQIANNAIHIYPYVTIDSTAFPSKEFAHLHRMVKTYFDTTGAAAPSIGNATSDYMWIQKEQTPLKTYMYYYWQENKLRNYYNAWTAVGPVFDQYGSYLVKKHPVAFAQYYLWPNTVNYFVPIGEMMNGRNPGDDRIDKKVAQWFHYKSTRLQTFVPVPVRRTLVSVFAYLSGLFNLVFLAIAAIALLKQRRLVQDNITRFTILVTAYWVTNFIFSIATSPLIMRYQFFPMIVTTGFALALLSNVLPIVFSKKGPASL